MRGAWDNCRIIPSFEIRDCTAPWARQPAARRRSSPPLTTRPPGRYKNVFSESQNPDANWVPAVHEKTSAEVQRISAALESNKFSDLFQSFTTDEMERFISYMAKEDFAEGTEIMTQGDQGDYFYVRAPMPLV